MKPRFGLLRAAGVAAAALAVFAAAQVLFSASRGQAAQGAVTASRYDMESFTLQAPQQRGALMRVYQLNGLLTLEQPGLKMVQIWGPSTESMQPVLGAGQRAIYRDARPEEIRAGDFILFDASPCALMDVWKNERGEALTLHQVVSVHADPWHVQTQGIGNRFPDLCPVTADMLRGVAVGVLWQ